MRRLAAVATVLTLTFGWLAALLAIQPLTLINHGMDRVFGALPAWTQVQSMYADPTTQEVSRGDQPLTSFRTLERAWAASPGATRVVLMGNSQSLTMSLSPGEPPPSGPEKTYPDLIAAQYRAAGGARVFYRLSAGALSYQEMLWYMTYLVARPAVRPNVLLVQLNYQNFVNGGIRYGMLELLSDPGFRQAIEQLAHGNRPDADAFLQALRLYDSTRPRGEETQAGRDRGDRLETSFRMTLDRLPGTKRRAALKQEFENMLWRCRSYFLHIQPATRRSLGGIRVASSRAALQDLLGLCRDAGIRVFLFQAPTNPAVPLYATTEDERLYHEFTKSLGPRYDAVLLDFEDRIPAKYWGMSLNVPDPLHLGREGHRMLARFLLAALEQNGI